MFKFLGKNRKELTVRLQNLEYKLEDLQRLIDDIKENFGTELKLLKEAHSFIKDDCIKAFDCNIQTNKFLQELLERMDKLESISKPKKRVKRVPKNIDQYNEL